VLPGPLFDVRAAHAPFKAKDSSLLCCSVVTTPVTVKILASMADDSDAIGALLEDND
jgi:hypothetical protein